MTVSAPAVVSPGRIVDIATGFMGAKQLFAASRIGLFRALADGPRTALELAGDTGRSEREVRILADAMLALGLLSRDDLGYRLAADAAAYLSGREELDLAPFLAFLNDISYPQWLGYDSTVDTDRPGTLELDDAGWGDFLAGVMTYNDLHAEQLAHQFDFDGFRSAVDIAGISPAFAVRAMEQNPDLRVEFVVDADGVAGVEAAIARAGVGARATVTGADPVTGRLSTGHDLVMVNHVLHRYGADDNRAILAQARAAAAPGAVLTVLDFFLDDDGEQRKLDALHAGEYYNIDGTVVYPIGLVRGWLAEAGWRVTGCLDLPGSPRVILAEAV